MKNIKKTSPQKNHKTILTSFIIFLMVIGYLAIVTNIASASTYYVDAASGNDNNAGLSWEQAWKTIKKPPAVASGDTILVKNGTYAAYEETISSSRTSWITYKAEAGHQPVIKNISITGNNHNAYLRFQGFKVQIPGDWYTTHGYTGAGFSRDVGIYHNWPDLVSPAPVTRYPLTDDCVHIENAHYIDINDCTIIGIHKYLTSYGVLLKNSNNSSVSHCDISSVEDPIAPQDSNDTVVTYNYCHNFYGSGIQPQAILKTCTTVGKTTISYNHIADQQLPLITDDYYYTDIHPGSGLAIRVSNCEIRCNIIHNIIGQGIMFYPGKTYADMVIENNLLYDVGNGLMNLFGLNGACRIRNNTLVGHVSNPDAGYAGFPGRYGEPSTISLFYNTTWMSNYSKDNRPVGWIDIAKAYDANHTTFAQDSSWPKQPNGYAVLDSCGVSGWGNPITVTLTTPVYTNNLGVISACVKHNSNMAYFRVHKTDGTWVDLGSPSYSNWTSTTTYFSKAVDPVVEINQIEVKFKIKSAYYEDPINYPILETNDVIRVYDIAYNDLVNGYAGSGVDIQNNIIVGNYGLNDPCATWDKYTENYNIWYRGFESASSRELILKGTHSRKAFWFFKPADYRGYQEYFEAIPGHSAWTPEYPKGSTRVPFFVDPNMNTGATTYGFTGPAHGHTLDYHLASSSPAINFGNYNNQPADSLGTIGADGFIQNNGPARNANYHSVGCYEYATNDFSFAPIGNKEVNVGSTLTFHIDVNGPDITIFIHDHNLPSEPNFINYIFSWTPDYNDVGTYEATFVAQSGLYEDSETIAITVNNVNRAPVLAAISDKSVNEGSPLSFTISATDADSDTITYSATGLPSGAALTGQIFNWTPNYNQAGTYQITFTATDGQAQSSKTVNITVSNVNRAPVLAAISDKSVNEGNPLSFTISATDADSDAITYSAAGLPSGAAFAGQTFNWTPNYNQAGTYQVTFTASDGQAQISQTVNLTVNDVAVPTSLLNENFDKGTFTDWSIINEGTKNGPSLWSAATGTLVQTSGIYTNSWPSQPGTYALYKAGTAWTNYRVSLTMKSTSNKSLGVMFRYKDKNNYYRFSWDNSRNQRQLVRKYNGYFTVLKSSSGSYAANRNYQVDIVANGATLQVFIDNVLVLQATDSRLSSGSIALYSWANAGSYFDNIVAQKP
jgi:hypothetical protein